jgi:hypothetical protein
MDINEAIAAHLNWKMQLLMYVEKVGDPKLGAVAQDDSCILGRWMKVEASRYAGNPTFETVRTVHARIHRLAGEIVRKADAGDKQGALHDIDGTFNELSLELKAQLHKLIR